MGDERVRVYVLLDHQSSVDSLMIFRTGLTMLRRWEQLVRDQPDRKTLPSFIAILVHHSATDWTAATTFAEMLETAACKGQKEIEMDRLDELTRKARTEERVRLLLRQLTARFGAVPAEAKARILGATGPMLARWSIRVLTEPTLEAVLGRTTTAKKTPSKTTKKKTAHRAATHSRARAAR
jgi:Putative transposase, YhgA-like